MAWSTLLCSVLVTCILLQDDVMARHKTAFDRIAAINSKYGVYSNNKLYQIDMKFSRSKSNAAEKDEDAPVRDRSSLWPGGIIPYTVTYNIRKSPKTLKVLEGAMQEWQRQTCIRFVRRTNQEDYVEFYYGDGCNSDVGRVGGKQTTSLGRGCAHHSIIVHELGHIVGFWHEQNRPDRDNYVDVLWDNIVTKFRFAFTKYSNRKIDSLGIEYDYYSVMHYGAKAFSKNNRVTIKAKKPNIRTFGNTHLSPLDIKQANLLYRCMDYPKFPRDFVWKTNGPSNHNHAYCTRIFEPRDRHWYNNYLCYRKDKRQLNIEWSYNGPLRGKMCERISAPRKRPGYSWSNNYLCVPEDSVYRFHWSTNGPISNKECMKITEPKDRRWDNDNYYLCVEEMNKAIDGGWTKWMPWKKCSRACGGGYQTRTRTCTDPFPSNGGKYCDGESMQRRKCNLQECKEWPAFPKDFVFGYFLHPPSGKLCIRTYERFQYSVWSFYLFCSADNKRDPGFRWSDMGAIPGMRCTKINEPKERYRGTWDNNFLCVEQNSPYSLRWSHKGSIRGLDCMKWYGKSGRDGWDNNYLCAQKRQLIPGIVDNDRETVHGRWSPWSGWSKCSKSCDGGEQQQTRECTNPAPSNGGMLCIGAKYKKRVCNQKPCAIRCGGTLNADAGKFTSPKFPGNYPENKDCTWLIRVPHGKIIEFKYNYFDLQRGNCRSGDYVELRDGPYYYSRLLARQCGSVKPNLIRSTRNSLFVKFHSNARLTHKGFDASWISIQRGGCGGNIKNDRGVVMSPLFPRQYSPNLNCQWFITVSAGRTIKLKFRNFDIHKTTGCSADYVEIREYGKYFQRSLGRYCGTGTPGPFNAGTNRIRVKLRTNRRDSGRGFKLEWEAVGKVVTTAPTLPPTTKRSLCPRGWTSFTSESQVNCYLLRNNVHTWFQARRECLSRGSDLLSIGTVKEQRFVQRHVLAESFMWIGFTDSGREGSWTWSDRTSVAYKNWAPGDPNNGGYHKNEHCGVLKPNGQWNDYPCNHRFRYICKKHSDRIRQASNN